MPKNNTIRCISRNHTVLTQQTFSFDVQQIQQQNVKQPLTIYDNIAVLITAIAYKEHKFLMPIPMHRLGPE